MTRSSPFWGTHSEVHQYMHYQGCAVAGRAGCVASDLTHEEPVPAGIKIGGVCVARPIRPRWVAEQLGIRFCRMYHKRHPLEWRPVLRQLDYGDCAADSFGVTRR